MATPRQVSTYDRAQRAVVTLARARLVAWWSRMDFANPEAAARALEAFLPELVSAYGRAAAAVAADWFEELRADAGASPPFRAALADPVPVDQVRASARWGMGPVFSDSPDADAALRRVAGTVQRLVQRPARETLFRSGVADPARPKWARVPRGPNPCAFCRMLAGRGAVYLSADSAGAFDAYHDDCWCVAEPVWRGGVGLSYDPAVYEGQYAEAFEEAGGNVHALLAAMRRQQGVK